MAKSSRLKLQKTLENIMGKDKVYYCPPSTLKMTYPCIVYSKANIDATTANDTMYVLHDRYNVTLISRTPDDPRIRQLLSLQGASYSNGYISDGLCHDVVSIRTINNY